jgi:hypothetical protein
MARGLCSRASANRIHPCCATANGHRAADSTVFLEGLTHRSGWLVGRLPSTSPTTDAVMRYLCNRPDAHHDAGAPGWIELPHSTTRWTRT